eukprot:scaffold248563_cov111-Cyclotella_meneghiniana.AAC.3
MPLSSRHYRQNVDDTRHPNSFHESRGYWPPNPRITIEQYVSAKRWLPFLYPFPLLRMVRM